MGVWVTVKARAEQEESLAIAKFIKKHFRDTMFIFQ